MVNKITDDTVDGILDTESKLTIIQFSAEWCGPCKMSSPILDNLSNENGDVSFNKIDVDVSGDNQKSPQLAAKYGVRGIPTVVFIVDGEEKERTVGMKSQSDLQIIIDSLK